MAPERPRWPKILSGFRLLFRPANLPSVLHQHDAPRVSQSYKLESATEVGASEASAAPIVFYWRRGGKSR
jgi:hypothetical protein